MNPTLHRGHLILGLGLLLLATGCRERENSDRQNFVFLFTDDQRADALGAYGNEHIQTPNIDRLAQDGFNFREAHVMGSHHGAVCAPSRAMLMSGRQLFRVYDNLDTVATFPEILRTNGYVTFGTGKWHQSSESFERSFSAGRNVYFGGMSDHNLVPVQHLQSDRTFTEPDSQGFSTDLFADAAIEFLDEHAAGGDPEPFLLYVSFTAPHDPRTPPERFAAYYQNSDIPVPENFLPVHPFDNGAMTLRDENLAAWPRDPEVIREQIREYYGLISHIDERIGDILDAVERAGVGRSTTVFFAADNGLALGSHGLLGKQSLYEHSTRVPLIVKGPGIAAGSSVSFVLLYDLFPTILRLAGIDIPAGTDGFDLGPIWRGERRRVRSVLYTAYGDNQRSIRDDRWKLILYPHLDRMQLYDLASDPHEQSDQSKDLTYAHHKDRLRVLLGREHISFGDPQPLEVDSLRSADFDYTSLNRIPDRHQPESVIRKYFDE